MYDTVTEVCTCRACSQDVRAQRSGLWAAGSTSEQHLQKVVEWSVCKQLTPVAQNIFYDLVSVLDWERCDLALRVWRAWWGDIPARAAFKRLQQLSYVSIDKGKLVVPDVIRSIGRSLLQAPVSSQSVPAELAGTRIWVGIDGKVRGNLKVGTAGLP